MLTPQQRIEDLYATYGRDGKYISVERDGTDYVLVVSGSFYYRGFYKIRIFDSEGVLKSTSGWIQGSTVDGQYVSLFGRSFPDDGVDNTPRIDKPNPGDVLPPDPPLNPSDLENIVNPYSSFDGYGEVDVKEAIEYVTGRTLTEQPDVQNDFGQNMYGLDRIGAPEAWAAGYTGDGIIIAVVDTGIDTDHPELDDNLWVNTDEIAGNGIDDDGNGYIDDRHGFNFRDGNSNINDSGYHGTHVSGTIAGEVGGQVQGVAYNAKLMTLKVFGANGSASGDDIAEAIIYAVDNGAHIVNLSLGIRLPETSVPRGDWESIRVAMKYANDNGVVVVSAAGNDRFSAPAVPGAYAVESGIVVGAVDQTGNLDTSYSNRAGGAKDYEGDGAEVPLYVSAAGTAIWSTFPMDGVQNLPSEGPDGYATIQGTSMASPHVAAAVTLMLEANPSLTPDQIRVALANTTQ